MPIQFNNIMRKSDWIKIAIILTIGSIAITLLYSEYQKTSEEYQKTISSALSEAEKLYK